MSFAVLTISISHFGVSGQYIQYKTNAQERQSVADRRIDTVTHTEYEYYDDDGEDYTTPQNIAITTSTTTSTTTTPKPITSYRQLTTHRNGFRPLLNYKQKKLDADKTRQQNQLDSYTEASNENAFVQKHNQLKQSTQPPPPPQLRNAIAEVNRRTAGKEYAVEKSPPTSFDSNNGNGGNFSRRYARFLFKLRSG